MSDKLPKTKAFLRDICFRLTAFDQDNTLNECKYCGQKAWLVKDIKHKRGCEVNAVMREVDKVE